MDYRLLFARVGRACRRYRENVLHTPVSTVAQTLGYGVGAVYQFEQGRNHNYTFLLWYLSQGMPVYLLFEEA